jgi:hypothetical protein
MVVRRVWRLDATRAKLAKATKLPGGQETVGPWQGQQGFITVLLELLHFIILIDVDGHYVYALVRNANGIARPLI